MVSINYSSREVCCKIVYYGPGLSGKTTNLQYVHSKVPSNTRGKLISLATEADRTLYFDFLPINIGTINGFAAKFQLYTVPGQVYYNATRKLVLRGVDGVVFVADSQPDKMEENIESLLNLEENLAEYGYNINEIPVVIQYNKRDLPGVLPVEQLNAQLNTRGWPYFEASATIGNGVFDTLKLIIKMVLDKAKSSSTTRPQPAAASATAQPATAATPTPPTPEPVTSPSPTPVAAAASPAPTPTPTPIAASGAASAQPQSTPPPVEQTAPPPPPPSPEPEPTPEPRQYRPFPGSDDDMSAKKITPASFSPIPREETREEEIEQKVLTDESEKDATPSLRQAPSMAPPIRRRSEKKKRGFFKRLFGLR